MSELEIPYDRAELKTGIVHLGVGNFHRAHQAMYVDALLRRGRADGWAICGAGVLTRDAAMRDALASQGFRYTLVECAPDGSREARAIGAIPDFLLGPDDPMALIAKLADAATRIVSLTVTEGGYNIDDATGEFDLADAAIAADLRPGAVPTTVFGYVTEALRRRRDGGVPPFTVMSCDNLQNNGDLARRAFVGFARAKDADLGAWIDGNVAFPNSMVDRITPATTDEHRELVRTEYGIDDAWPVICEDFTQWVLEDRFTMGRPPFEEVGVQVVDDVRPYEKLKLRMLNGAHQAIAYAGLLRGHTYVHQAVADPAIRSLLRAYFAEAVSTLDPVPGVDPDEYAPTLMARFANPTVADTLARLATDASDRIPKFVLPVVSDNLAEGRMPAAALSVLSAWARCIRGADEHGSPIALQGGRLAAVPGQADARDAVWRPEIIGDLAAHEDAAALFRHQCNAIEADGVASIIGGESDLR